MQVTLCYLLAGTLSERLRAQVTLCYLEFAWPDGTFGGLGESGAGAPGPGPRAQGVRPLSRVATRACARPRSPASSQGSHDNE
jgi:hypothetical protein